MNYIDDGEIHPLSDEFAYIINYVESDEFENAFIFQDIMKDFLKKYANYLIEFEKDKVIEILVKEFMPSIFGKTSSDEYTFIYRKPWMVGVLAQRGALSLKFKRSKNDNLGEN